VLSTKSPDEEVLLSYGKSNGWLDHAPAIITRKIGKGSITYIGACFDDASMKILAQWMATSAGVTTPLPNVPEGVEASQRYGAHHVVTILVNFSGREQEVPLPTPMENVLEGGQISRLHLAKYGVAVLDHPR
jgi:beta-galactosidase